MKRQLGVALAAALVTAWPSMAAAAEGVPAPTCGEITSAGLPAALGELMRADERIGGDGAAHDRLAALFDDEVILFAVPVPGFGIGREQALEHFDKALGPPPAALRAQRVRAGISADCTHGFTLGFTETAAGAGDSLGKYVAYWVRRPAGWRIALFKLVPREAGAAASELAPAVPSFAAWAGAKPLDLEQARASLAAREQAFSDAAQRIGLGPAFEQFGSADAVNTGGGAAFVVGNKAIGDLHGTGPSPLHWAADGGVLVSGSGDLGVTWGMLHRNGPTPPGRLAQIPFFTVWRRAGPSEPWLYVAE
jgi:hypothetical protein